MEDVIAESQAEAHRSAEAPQTDDVGELRAEEANNKPTAKMNSSEQVDNHHSDNDVMMMEGDEGKVAVAVPEGGGNALASAVAVPEGGDDTRASADKGDGIADEMLAVPVIAPSEVNNEQREEARTADAPPVDTLVHGEHDANPPPSAVLSTADEPPQGSFAAPEERPPTAPALQNGLERRRQNQGINPSMSDGKRLAATKSSKQKVRSSTPPVHEAHSEGVGDDDTKFSGLPSPIRPASAASFVGELPTPKSRLHGGRANHLPLAYRVGSASSAAPRTASQTPITRPSSSLGNVETATQHHKKERGAFIAPPVLKSRLLTEFLSLDSAISEAYDPLVADGGAGHSNGWAAVHDTMRKVLLQVDAQLHGIPGRLRRLAEHDSPRHRELLLMLSEFLTHFTESADCSTDESTEASTTVTSPSHVPSTAIMKQESLRRHVDAMRAFFRPPAMVHVSFTEEDGFVDVCRQAQDGSSRLSMHRVPVSLSLCATQLAATKQAADDARRALHEMLEPHVVESQMRPTFAAGSPHKTALLRRQKSTTPELPSPGSLTKDSHSVAAEECIISVDSETLRSALTRCRKTEAAHMVAQEHRALVQLLHDLGALGITSRLSASVHRRHSANAANSKLSSLSMDHNTSTAATAPRPESVGGKGGLESSAALAAMRESLYHGVEDVDRQLRSLRNTPSQEAANEAKFRASRQVVVDKEELLLRDRDALRRSLDVIDACADEIAKAKQLMLHERSMFVAAAQTFRSTAEGRDDEIKQRVAEIRSQRIAIAAARAENVELKQMLRRLLQHVMDIDARHEAVHPGTRSHPSPCQSPPPSSPVASSRVNHAVGTATATSIHSTDVSVLLDTVASIKPTPSVLTHSATYPPLASAESELASLQYRRSTPESRTSSPKQGSRSPVMAQTVASVDAPSRSIFQFGPDLRAPRKLTHNQQSHLSQRLHDSAVQLRKDIEATSPNRNRPSAAHSHSPSPHPSQRRNKSDAEIITCTKRHVLPSVGRVIGSPPDGADEDWVPPSIDDVTSRMYTQRKQYAEQCREKVWKRLLEDEEKSLRESPAAKHRSLNLKSKVFTSVQEMSAAAEKQFTDEMKRREQLRAKLFDELVLDKETAFAPKKRSADDIAAIVDRLSGGANK